MADTQHHAVTIALDHEQHESRRRNLRSALRELSELRARRATPVPIVHQHLLEEPLPAGRRRLFTFAARARHAVEPVNVPEQSTLASSSVPPARSDQVRS